MLKSPEYKIYATAFLTLVSRLTYIAQTRSKLQIIYDKNESMCYDRVLLLT